MGPRILHCPESPIYAFPEMKLPNLVPNSYIHIFVSDLYIPKIAHRYKNVELGDRETGICKAALDSILSSAQWRNKEVQNGCTFAYIWTNVDL